MNTELLKQQFDSVLHGSYPGYSLFIENILRPIFGEIIEFEYGGEDMLTAYDYSPAITASILKANKVAQINSIDSNTIEVYDVTIKDSVNITRARVGIRELIKRLEFPYSHAFILFHYEQPEGHSWRFSYFYKEGTNASTTSGKRYTYVFGPQYTARTARDRFVELSQTEIKNDKALLKTFSVEALSNEFFDEYRDLYADFIQYITGKRYVKTGANKWEEKKLSEPNETIYSSFDRNDKDIRDYIKKMMGRLVFLCFLQRKGWLGNNKQYLQDLFANSANQDNFLEAVLEPLFFGLLNTKPEERPALFATKDWDISLIPAADTIPYLNGGLFEQDDNDDRVVAFPKEMFQRLFDFFASYNFTIDENDPNDAEIGVDPEMLGKIFESLLEDNKDKGAFYTPKEIVQYMCRESLIAYLTTKSVESNNGKFPREQVETKVRELLTDPNKIVPKMTAEQLEKFGKAIREVKICDPAVGSGAFPMGLLNELVRCRVSIHAWAKDEKGNLLEGDYAELKRDIIQNNIYGVDIEKGAIDIARLRFWLSIVVDEETPKALPNFDYKFMVGNSLISTFDGEYINLDTKGQKHTNTIKMNEKKQELLRLKRRYYDASGDDKLQLGIEIKDTILQLVSLQLGYELKSWAASHVEQSSLFPEPKQMTIQEIVSQLPPERQRIVDLGKQLRARLADTSIPLIERARTDIQFFDWRMMFTEVFDRENGGFDIVIGNPPYIKEYENKDAFTQLKKTPYYKAKMDIWFLFTCVGLDLLRRNGIISFIAQPQWRTSEAASIMRNKICDEAQILQIVDFGNFMVFDASTQAMIFVIQKKVESIYNFLFKIVFERMLKENITDFLYSPFNHVEFDKKQFYNKPFTFSIDGKENELLKKLEKMRNFAFDPSNEIIQGIIGGPDKAFKLCSSEVCSFTPFEQLLIKQFYTSTLRYYTPCDDLRLIYITESNTPSFNKETHPNIYVKFHAFEEELKGRREVLMGRKPWWSLWWERDENFFKAGEKIVFASRTLGRSFTYTEGDFYVSRNCFVIKSDRVNLKYIVALLNSTILNFYMHRKLKKNGELLQLDKVQFLNIPLCIGNKADQAPIISLVDRILAAKQSDPAADTSDLENQIDELVYDLYGLTEDEKEIIRKG